MSTIPATHVFKTVERCQIRADVYLPSGAEPPYPAVVYLHGGALIFGSRKGINARQCEAHVSSGFAVIAVDYRLAPETKLPAIIEDLQDAFRWVRQRGPDLFSLDPERVAAVGHSAGGYLTLMAGSCVTPRPRALVSFYGYGDIVADWYTKPDPFYCQQPLVSEEESGRLTQGPTLSEPYEGRGRDKFYLYCRQRGIWPQEVSGRTPATEPGFFVPYCPLRNVSADYPPTLLLHGTADTDVPYEQSAFMAQELSRHGIASDLVTIEGGPHGFDRQTDDPRVIEAFDRVVDFLREHLGS